MTSAGSVDDANFIFVIKHFQSLFLEKIVRQVDIGVHDHIDGRMSSAPFIEHIMLLR